MSDCQNAEIRDMLPDLVHGTLAGTERGPVESHVASCAECAGEVTLLRAAHRALARSAPAVDVAGIVRVLPAPPAAPRPSVPGVVSIEEARRARRAAPAHLGGWRRAAAVLLLAAGATTVAVMRGDFGSATSPTTPRVTGPVAVAPRANGATQPLVPVPDAAAPVVAGPGLSMAAGVSDLSDDQLVALLGDLDALDAAPDLEPASLLPDMTGEEGSE